MSGRDVRTDLAVEANGYTLYLSYPAGPNIWTWRNGPIPNVQEVITVDSGLWRVVSRHYAFREDRTNTHAAVQWEPTVSLILEPFDEATAVKFPARSRSAG